MACKQACFINPSLGLTCNQKAVLGRGKKAGAGVRELLALPLTTRVILDVFNLLEPQLPHL